MGCGKEPHYDNSIPHEYITAMTTDKQLTTFRTSEAKYLLSGVNHFKPGECQRKLNNINERKAKLWMSALNQTEGRDIKGVVFMCEIDIGEDQECLNKMLNHISDDGERGTAKTFARTLRLCRITKIIGKEKAVLLRNE